MEKIGTDCKRHILKIFKLRKPSKGLVLTCAFLIENASCTDARSPNVHTKTIESSYRFHEKRMHLERLSRGKILEK